MLSGKGQTCIKVLSRSVMPHFLRPHESSPPGLSVHGVLQAKTLDWVAISFLRGSSNPSIKPGSPELLADSLPSAPSGKPCIDLGNPGSGVEKIGGVLRTVTGTRSEPDWQKGNLIRPCKGAASSGSGRISCGPQPRLASLQQLPEK